MEGSRRSVLPDNREAGFRGEKAADGRQFVQVRRDDAFDALAIGRVQPFHHGGLYS